MMDHLTFMSRLLRPTYVWRMACGVVPFTGAREDHPLVRSGRTRMTRAQAEIDQLVLERARAIEREQQDARQCAAMSRGDNPVRCECGVNHGSQGSYWMEG